MLLRSALRCFSNANFIVQPDLNFDRYFIDLKRLQQLLANRGIEELDVNTLYNCYDQWKRLKVGEGKLKEASDHLLSNATPEESIETCRSRLKQVRQRLREFDALIETLQQLPNDLDVRTPIGDCPRLLRCVGKKKALLCDHGELLSQKGWLFLKREQFQCFLIGRGCDMLTTLERYVLNMFAASEFNLISPPHLVRAAVVRTGAAPSNSHLCVQNSSCSHTDDQSLYLVGHSIFPYLALLTRRSLSKKMSLPVKLFSIGNAYCNDLQDTSLDEDLFSFRQSRTLTAFVILDCVDSLNDTMNSLLGLVEKTLTDLDIQASVWQVPSKLLAKAESARVNVTTTSHKGIEHCLASVSNYGDYLSRKLRMMCQPDKYMQCLYLEINLHRLLAAIIEQWWSLENCSRLPSCLDKFN
ncbi:hypothetical protein M514_00275, partial [Trichuris suis]